MIVPVARESVSRNRNDRRSGDRQREEISAIGDVFGIKICDIMSSYVGANFLITSVTSAATSFWYLINGGIQQTNVIVV